MFIKGEHSLHHLRMHVVSLHSHSLEEEMSLARFRVLSLSASGPAVILHPKINAWNHRFAFTLHYEIWDFHGFCRRFRNSSYSISHYLVDYARCHTFTLYLREPRPLINLNMVLFEMYKAGGGLFHRGDSFPIQRPKKSPTKEWCSTICWSFAKQCNFLFLDAKNLHEGIILYTLTIWLTSCCVMIDGRKGQQWTSQAKLKASSCMNKWNKYEPGLYALGTEPRVGIGQRAFLIQTSRTSSPPSLFYLFKVQDLGSLYSMAKGLGS